MGMPRPTVSPYTPGMKLGAWTLLELIEPGPNAAQRMWLMQCSCGWKARRWENTFERTRLSVCSACANALVKRKKSADA